MLSPTSKKVLMSLLVGAFVVQTAFVYGDAREGPIDEAAQRGRQIWHERGCQACHQLWGNGGFLGPDLTNAASRVDDVRLGQLLTVGSGQMPAMGLSEAQIADVRAFLESIDRPDLGRGQLRLGSPDEASGPWERYDLAAADLLPAGAPVTMGHEAYRARICSTCHLPLEDNALTGALDPSGATERLSEAELRTVLLQGRPENGMPPPVPAFSEEELDAVIAYLGWMADNREELAEGMRTHGSRTEIRWSDLPWWEYR